MFVYCSLFRCVLQLARTPSTGTYRCLAFALELVVQLMVVSTCVLGLVLHFVPDLFAADALDAAMLWLHLGILCAIALV